MTNRYMTIFPMIRESLTEKLRVYIFRSFVCVSKNLYYIFKTPINFDLHLGQNKTSP